MATGRVFALVLAPSLTFVPASPSLGKSTLSGELPRQAQLGFATSPVGHGVLVQRVEPDCPAARAGLGEGDLILTVNGARPEHPRDALELLRRLDGGRPVALVVERDGQSRDVRFTPPPRPLEAIEGVDSYYGDVRTPDGAHLRTIVTRPEGVSGPLPAIFFLQWVSCGSIEHRPNSTASRILATLARESGMALIRVERSTSGDSEGPGCHELDYDTELAHYRHAFDELVRLPGIDRDRVVVYGSSLGSTTAPLLAESVLRDGGKIAGVIVQGGGAVTYFERMLSFDRIYLERRPRVDPKSIHEEMLRRVLFHAEYLIRGRSPDDVAADGPAMAAVRADVRGLGDGVHYGRPYAWHQQAARRNFLAAWAAISAPVLVVFNEYDQFETRHGHELIVDVVNRLRPGTATLVEQPQVGHSNELFPSTEAAYADEIGVPVPQLITSRILSWLREEGLAPLTAGARP